MSEVMGYDRGWHLRGSSLWFDAERRRELCLLTGGEARLPPMHRRVVASAPLARALGRLGYRAAVLPTPWQRSLGIGGARVQLFDARGKAGAAVVRLETREATCLVAGLLRMAPFSTPPASHFSARLPAAGHRGAALRDVAIGLATAITNLPTGAGPVRVWVDHPEAGLAVIDEMALLGHPLAPRGTLARWAGGESDVRARHRAAGTMALLPRLDGTAARWAAGTEHMMIDSGIGALPDAGIGAALSATFCLAYFADVQALRLAVRQCRAQSVVLADVPLASESRVRQALSPGVSIKFISDPGQLPLAQ